MTVDENEQLVRQEFDSIWNEGEYHEERFTDDYVAHGWAPEPIDLEQERADTAAFRNAFPDIHKEIEDLFGEGDRVALRYRFTGTHEGEFEGIEPTGEEVSTSGIFIYRIEDGRIAESWLNYDGLNLLGQLGVL